MQIRISSNGEIVVPGSFAEALGAHPGDSLEASVETGRIVLTQPANRANERRAGAGMITDPKTGWPVLSGGDGAPQLTNDMVAEILADFP